MRGLRMSMMIELRRITIITTMHLLVISAYLFVNTLITYANATATTSIGNGVASKLSTLHIEQKNAALLFFGTAHSFSPENPQLQDIEDMWRRFRPDVVLIEGGSWPLAKNRTEAVSKYGEMGFSTWLASITKTKIVDADPPIVDEMHHVAKVHTFERTKLYYVLRMVPQWRDELRNGTSGTLQEKLVSFLNSPNFKKIDSLANILTTEEAFEKAFRTHIPNVADWKTIDWKVTSGMVESCSINAVAKTSARYRDQHMVKKIMQFMQEGKRVLVVAGNDHLIEQQPMLRDALKLNSHRD
jgi:hypothetical protein